MVDKGKKDSRQAVRVTSRILFSCKPFSAKEVKQIFEDFNNGISLYNREKLADVQVYVGAQTALSRLKDKDNDLATYLQHMDGKINTLLKTIDNKHSILDELVLQTIDLGGNGIAFWADQDFLPKQIVEMNFLLQPAHIFINSFGSVVSCTEDKEANETGKNRVSVKFELIMDEDRESLIQYNFKQQALALKRRRDRTKK